MSKDSKIRTVSTQPCYLTDQLISLELEWPSQTNLNLENTIANILKWQTVLQGGCKKAPCRARLTDERDGGINYIFCGHSPLSTRTDVKITFLQGLASRPARASDNNNVKHVTFDKTISLLYTSKLHFICPSICYVGQDGTIIINTKMFYTTFRGFILVSHHHIMFGLVFSGRSDSDWPEPFAGAGVTGVAGPTPGQRLNTTALETIFEFARFFIIHEIMTSLSRGLVLFFSDFVQVVIF